MKKLLLFTAMLCFVLSTMAIPARRAPKTVKQSDGTELVVYLTGDESFHYYATADGLPLVREANGDYCYAQPDAQGILVSTKRLAHNLDRRSTDEAAHVAALRRGGLEDSMSKIAADRSLRFKEPRNRIRTILPEGEINVPVILVEFSDYKFTFERQDVDDNFNAENYSGPENPVNVEIPGSLRDYFIAQSDGIFTPNFVVSKIVTLDNPMSYYGGNKTNGDDKNPQQMIIDACKKLDGEMDFSIFDNNGDGEVEFLYCIYAGYSEAAGAEEDAIWPHQWYLSSQLGTITLDGVKIDNYACSSELSLNADYESRYGRCLSGIGACCHEFSHCLGLPDFYDTNNAIPAFGMDYWDLMDYGCYNAEGYVPIGYSAYERDFVGWRPLTELYAKGDYTMEALTAGGTGYKIVNEKNSNEYYVIENRQQQGWDRYIFNSGMLITHVDYLYSAWYKNTVNSDKSHQRFTLIPADGKLTTYYDAANTAEYRQGLQGDIWPGIKNNTELTNTSTPAAKVFTGGYMNKPITNIKNENGVVSFTFLAGLDVPTNIRISDITDEGFTAKWDAVEYAKEYKVELYKLTEGIGTTETVNGKEYIVEQVSTVKVDNNECKFTALEGNTLYRIAVTAIDGNDISEPSAFAYVTILPTGIDAVVTDGGKVQIFDLLGRKVDNPTKGVYIIRNGNSTKKIMVK